jgi:hypothetical protein
MFFSTDFIQHREIAYYRIGFAPWSGEQIQMHPNLAKLCETYVLFAGLFLGPEDSLNDYLRS